MSTASYTGNVAKLLTFGDCHQMDWENWPDYPTEVGLQPEDIPELIRMAIDRTFDEMDSDRLEVWAPIHAWRALGQLKAEAAIVPLTTILNKDLDWVWEELPRVYSMIGPAAIPVLADLIRDPSQDDSARNTAVDCLKEIAITHPESRNACVAPLMQQLEAFEENDITLNTSLIANLMDLKATEAAAAIEKAFAAERVDEFMVGSWPSVQIDLGLKQETDFSPDELKPKVPASLTDVKKMLDLYEAQMQQLQGFGKGVPAAKISQKKASQKKASQKKKKKK
ncbi:HEAT repeat domain-containing protein [Leptodesmis sp.]|uniref:HEAT repeat domain-containing protein n=1 Tax=Leptodesmis sp. TaxID=3100501 RepID=UPI0040534800